MIQNFFRLGFLILILTASFPTDQKKSRAQAQTMQKRFPSSVETGDAPLLAGIEKALDDDGYLLQSRNSEIYDSFLKARHAVKRLVDTSAESATQDYIRGPGFSDLVPAPVLMISRSLARKIADYDSVEERGRLAMRLIGANARGNSDEMAKARDAFTAITDILNFQPAPIGEVQNPNSFKMLK